MKLRCKYFVYVLLCTIFISFNFVHGETEPQDLLLIRIQKGSSYKFGYINTSGKIVIDPRFQEAWDYSEGLAPVRIKNKWGYIDETGNMVIKPQFNQISLFKEGLAAVASSTKPEVWGYIDKTGRYAIEPKYDVALNFSNGLARVVTRNKKYIYIDKKGRQVFARHPFAEDFFDQLAMFKTLGNAPGSKIGYINKEGKIAIEAKYEGVTQFSEGLACVFINNKAGYIDTSGNIIISFQFDSCTKFSEGLAAISLEGKWGYIDKMGEVIISTQFKEARQFSDGLAIISLDNEGNYPTLEKELKYGVINKSGNIIVEPKYEEISEFSNGTARVSLEGYTLDGYSTKWGYINKKGEYLWKSW